ncbi:MAG: enolase C-terminal domain-like protein [Planctomycetota bacterium]|nr:enolase C-terminal domain-like protein [Planctomycetota bacterium]
MTLKAYTYRLPLAKPLRLGDLVVNERRGWLLRSEDGVGDACPLPNFSLDTLDDVDAFVSREAAPTASVTWATFTTRPGVARVLDAKVRTAGLVTDIDDADAPCACVKLKVGRAPLRAELQTVSRLRSQGVRLRLDGNRALSVDAAQQLADAAGDALEFFEEPVAAADLEHTIARMPVALDEALLEREVVPAGAAAFVLKPTLLGADRTLALVQLAEARGTPVIISSCYESAVGRAALVRFAAAVAPDATHGLGTGPAFAADFEGWLRADGEHLIASDGALPKEAEWVTC